MVKFNFYRFSFYLSLVVPVFILLYIFGINVFSVWFSLFLFLTTISVIVLSIFAIRGKEDSSDEIYSIIALVLGVIFLLVWIFGFIFAISFGQF